MANPRVSAAGGLAALRYVLRKGREAGGILRLYRRLRTSNTCKTCALGMGGIRGGMVNEAGHFPEICKKSVQAQAADMAGAIPEEFFAEMSIGDLAGWSPAALERLGRLAFPVIARPGDTHFRRIPWEDALDAAADGLREASPNQVFFYASGRAGNEAAFLFQLVARAYGTSNVHNCSYYCHAASGAALERAVGSGTATVVLDDLAQADFALVAGANPASNHPRLITQLVQLRRRGGTVVIINPLKELGLVRFRLPSDWRSMLFGSTVSDVYMQPHIGSDIALFKALLKGLIERGGVDHRFIDSYSTGWDEVRADLASASWDILCRVCGIPRPEIDRVVAAIMRAKRGILLWAMGLTHHAHGVESIQALTNLAIARGWIGRPGCGLLPIRGHSNVQGVGSVGVTPVLKEAFAKKMAELYGIQTAGARGQDTYASMQAASEGRIKAALHLGGNLYASNPDSRWAATALQRIPVSVSMTTKLNEGHIHGRGRTAIVLPVLARDEEHLPTTQESMFNYVRLSVGGSPAVAGEMRSEVDVIAALAERILPPNRFEWSDLRSHRHLRKAIGQIVPGYDAIADIDKSHREFQIGGRTFHEPRFSTPDGRAHLHVTPLPDLTRPPGTYCLMTIRSEGQFNTVVYEEEDLYRGISRRDVVMMDARDAASLGVREGERVIVTTETGSMEASVALVDIRPGNIAMYFPEANVLVDRRLDPRSKTPAFKSVTAQIVPCDRS